MGWPWWVARVEKRLSGLDVAMTSLLRSSGIADRSGEPGGVLSRWRVLRASWWSRNLAEASRTREMSLRISRTGDNRNAPARNVMMVTSGHPMPRRIMCGVGEPPDYVRSGPDGRNRTFYQRAGLDLDRASSAIMSKRKDVP